MNIDLTLLLTQKTELVGLSMENQSGSMDIKKNFLSPAQAEALDGIINLLDAIGDEFIDGKTPEFKRVDENKFPNGFQNWVETHHLIVGEVETILNSEMEACPQKLHDIQMSQGTGGVWKLCEDLTDKFEQENIGVEWDGEWLEAIDAFITKELA